MMSVRFKHERPPVLHCDVQLLHCASMKLLMTSIPVSMTFMSSRAAPILRRF